MADREALAATLPDLIRSLGLPSFADAWLRAVDAVTTADHVSLFTFDLNCSTWRNIRIHPTQHTPCVRNGLCGI